MATPQVCNNTECALTEMCVPAPLQRAPPGARGASSSPKIMAACLAAKQTPNSCLICEPKFNRRLNDDTINNIFDFAPLHRGQFEHSLKQISTDGEICNYYKDTLGSELPLSSTSECMKCVGLLTPLFKSKFDVVPVNNKQLSNICGYNAEWALAIKTCIDNIPENNFQELQQKHNRLKHQCYSTVSNAAYRFLKRNFRHPDEQQTIAAYWQEVAREEYEQRVLAHGIISAQAAAFNKVSPGNW